MDCCDTYAEEFDRAGALAGAQRYRHKGLTGPGRYIAEQIVAHGVSGRRVVEFGGGVGAVGIELLKAGARSVVNVELSASYRDAAAALAREEGFADRIELRIGDAAGLAGDVGPAEVVIMNKVVCCYPDGGALMMAASAIAGEVLAVSYPSIHPVSRAVIGIENWVRRRRGSDFRAFVHPRSTFSRAGGPGWRRIRTRTGPVWSVGIWAAPIA